VPPRNSLPPERAGNVSEVRGARATFTADAALNCLSFADTKTIIVGDRLGLVHLLKLEE